MLGTPFWQILFFGIAFVPTPSLANIPASAQKLGFHQASPTNLQAPIALHNSRQQPRLVLLCPSKHCETHIVHIGSLPIHLVILECFCYLFLLHTSTLFHQHQQTWKSCILHKLIVWVANLGRVLACSHERDASQPIGHKYCVRKPTLVHSCPKIMNGSFLLLLA